VEWTGTREPTVDEYMEDAVLDDYKWFTAIEDVSQNQIPLFFDSTALWNSLHMKSSTVEVPIRDADYVKKNQMRYLIHGITHAIRGIKPEFLTSLENQDNRSTIELLRKFLESDQENAFDHDPAKIPRKLTSPELWKDFGSLLDSLSDQVGIHVHIIGPLPEYTPPNVTDEGYNFLSGIGCTDIAKIKKLKKSIGKQKRLRVREWRGNVSPPPSWTIGGLRRSIRIPLSAFPGHMPVFHPRDSRYPPCHCNSQIRSRRSAAIAGGPPTPSRRDERAFDRRYVRYHSKRSKGFHHEVGAHSPRVRRGRWRLLASGLGQLSEIAHAGGQ